MYLSEEEVQSYRENGFIKLEDIFTTLEVDALSDEYSELFARKSLEGQQLEATWRGGAVEEMANKEQVSVQSIHNLQFHSAVFTAALTHPRLMAALEDLMGTPNIVLHHTKAHLKPPGRGAPFPTHQDYHYFPYKNDSMVAVFVVLDDTDPENGGLAVYPGSHLLGPQEDVGAAEKGSGYHYLDQKKFPLSKATPVCAKRGDVIVFSYLLIHGSYLNSSKDRARRMFLIQLMAADDEPLTETHKSPAQGLVLRGRNVKRDATIQNRHLH